LFLSVFFLYFAYPGSAVVEIRILLLSYKRIYVKRSVAFSATLMPDNHFGCVT